MLNDVKQQYEMWKNLPGFGWRLRYWLDRLQPVSGSEDNVDGLDIPRWKNFHSFAARLESSNPNPPLDFPIWMLRASLESPLMKGEVDASEVWVASEWVIRCGDLLFQMMTSNKALDPRDARAVKTGSLYIDKPPLSIGRWEFWKKRFSEIVADANDLEFDSATIAHVSVALERMDAVDKSSGPSSQKLQGNSEASSAAGHGGPASKNKRRRRKRRA